MYALRYDDFLRSVSVEVEGELIVVGSIATHGEFVAREFPGTPEVRDPFRKAMREVAKVLMAACK